MKLENVVENGEGKEVKKVTTQGSINALLVKLWDEYALIYEKSFGKISIFRGFAKKLEEYLLPVPGRDSLGWWLWPRAPF